MQKKKKVFISIFLIILFCVAGYKLYKQQEDVLVYTGTVEVTKVDITTKTNGYIDFLQAKEGDTIAKGALVARIDQADSSAQLERDTLALEKAKVQLMDLEKGARIEEINAATASTAAMDSVYQKALADYQRYQELYNSDVVAKQSLDNAKSAYEVAYQNLQAAKENEKLVLAGNRSDVILAQKIEVERLTAVLKASKLNYQDHNVYSPINGVVLTKNFEAGEYVGVGNSLFTLGDLSDCWVKIYIPSTEIGKVKLKEEVKVFVDAYPERVFVGRVKEISEKAEFTPRQSITKNERTNMVFAVKIAVENTEGILKPGMPMDVRFND
ncbi:HlyD family secretion protein [Anaerosinus sp.]|uniref:HlyD family secretion protein n=1 Tax=Selenobaculum sp. TaxID=3074374 RepID=UPI0015AC6EAD